MQISVMAKGSTPNLRMWLQDRLGCYVLGTGQMLAVTADGGTRKNTVLKHLSLVSREAAAEWTDGRLWNILWLHDIGLSRNPKALICFSFLNIPPTYKPRLLRTCTRPRIASASG